MKNISIVAKYDSDMIKIEVPTDKINKGEYYYLKFFFGYEIKDELYQIHLNKIEKFNLDIFNIDLHKNKCQSILDNMIQLVEEG